MLNTPINKTRSVHTCSMILRFLITNTGSFDQERSHKWFAPCLPQVRTLPSPADTIVKERDGSIAPPPTQVEKRRFRFRFRFYNGYLTET